MTVPQTAEFVIIGGGAVGCAMAHALTESGRNHIVVIERRPRIAQGTTSQGAGLCGQVRTTIERVRLAMHSAQTLARMQAASAPVRPGWREVGSLRFALTEARVQECQQLVEIATEAGLHVELLESQQIRRYWPNLQCQAVLAAIWCPSDGYMVPAEVVATYEYYCREAGVQFCTDTEVQQILCRDGRVAALQTNQGTIECKYAINAAGPSAYHVARLVGLEFPIVPVRHQYLISRPLPDLDGSRPVLRIPDLGLYARCEGPGLLLGGFEEHCQSCSQSESENNACDLSREPDWDVLETFRQQFSPFMPEAMDSGTVRVAKGWPTFTPDGRFILGESSHVPGFVMAGGCNAHGISGSPGLGKALVESLFATEKSAFVQSLHPDRFHEHTWTWDAARAAAEHHYSRYYQLASCAASIDGI